MPGTMVPCAEDTGLLASDVMNAGPHAALTVDMAALTSVLFNVAVEGDRVA